MISLNFGLFHSGCPLSYLRYLTFKSLRHFHPHSRIQLFISTKCNKTGYRWHREKQDFENVLPDQKDQKDYINDLEALGVEVVYVDMFGQYPPNFQSDFFRWWWLKNNGGFYLDTDQIILKSFAELPLQEKLIYTQYNARSCGVYTPVGVIGASQDSLVVDTIIKLLPQFYDPNNYNSLGPFMFRSIINGKKWGEGTNVPSFFFYPIPESDFMSLVYSGQFKIPNGSFASHWFGGHPLSQKFNSEYTEEFAQKSEDTLSVWLRKHKII